MKSIVLIPLLALLAACATQAPRTLAPGQLAAAEAAQEAREAALRREPGWSLTGRLAVSAGRNGGSGRLDWRQNGANFDVSVSAPVTRQSWRLSGDAGGARLEGLDGGPRTGPDAATLLREATGWEIPVVALADWVRGARAPALGPAQVEFDADGRLRRLGQGGWTIDYTWPDAASGPGAMPSRLDARRGDARVKLVIDAWASAE